MKFKTIRTGILGYECIFFWSKIVTQKISSLIFNKIPNRQQNSHLNKRVEFF